jgi:hypothetical protein
MKDLQNGGINIPEFVLVNGHKEGEVDKDLPVTLKQIEEEH